MRRLATSSRTIMQALEKKTVALGMRIERKLLDFSILILSYYATGKV